MSNSEIMSKTLIIILLLTICSIAHTEEEPYYFGIEGGYGFTNYDAGFNQFEGIDKCGIYEDGNGNAMFARLWGEYRVLDFLNVGAHIQYTQKDGILDKLDTAYARDLNTGNIGIINTNNELDVNYTSISVGLDFNFLIQEELFNGPLYLNISPGIIINHSGNFIQKEYIQSPDGAAFEGPDGYFFERTNAEGDFTTLSNMIPIVSASLYNSSKIADNLYFTQRIGLTNDMSSLLDDANISSLTLFASLGIKMSFDKEKIVIVPPKKPIQPEPIIPVPEPYISLDMDVNYDSTYIELQEKLYAHPPMVLAIFFDKNSSDIRENYLSKSDNVVNPIQAHNNIIYDVNQILKDNPESKLKLISSTSGIDENNNIKLSQNRANSVRSKLVDLGVSEERIEINSKISPITITNIEYDTGLEENRRVEFQFTDIDMDNVNLKTIRKNLFSEISIETNAENLTGKANLTTNFTNETYTVNDTTMILDYSENLLNSKFNSTKLTSNFIANKLVKNANQEIIYEELDKRKLDLNTENFELYLMFDFSSSVLSDKSKKNISDLIDLLPEGKTLEIVGNTDNIGMEKANIEIAENRANNAKEYIESITTKQYYFDIKTNTSKFDESTPQGRFLNRSIRIKIR